MEKLVNILDNFPKVEDIHPFYGDLFNVLYDKDHYKLALGHVKSTKNMIENMSRDYLKLIKYADSLYRCKSLKRAALGRMCTMIRKISSSLSYLEEVRKHMARLPTINPYERTILLTGYPNVGKSSFINCVSKANVEVQPYPFTTKALYIGHTDHNNLRYQVIDSPGILDHQLEDMNTIEMQSITALAHLKSCVIYFVDPSEQCGYSVLEQIHLYHTIKPLFKNKPVLVVFNKIDLKRVEDLVPEKKAAVEQWLLENKLPFMEISTLEKVGIDAAKVKACEAVLDIKQAVPDKYKIKSEESYLNGMYVAQPKKRDNVERPATQVDFSLRVERPNIKKTEEENGGAGVFSIPLQEHYVIPEEWRYDAVPEIYNGKNVADFVDADIWQKLEELEREELEILAMEGLKIEEEEPLVEEDIQEAYKEIRRKKHVFREEHALKKHQTAYAKNKNIEDIKEALEQQGLDPTLVEERLRNRSRSHSLAVIKRKKSGDMDEELEDEERAKSRIREASRSRSKGYHRSMSREEISGKKVIDKQSKKWRTEDKRGESDRFIGIARPRHLFSGKTGKGSRDRR